MKKNKLFPSADSIIALVDFDSSIFSHDYCSLNPTKGDIYEIISISIKFDIITA